MPNDKQTEAQRLAKAEFAPAHPGANNPAGAGRNLAIVYDIPVEVSAQLGATLLPIRELLAMNVGSLIELDRLAGEAADLLVNGVLIGRGDVVVVDDNYGLRITEIIGSDERLRSLQED